MKSPEMGMGVIPEAPKQESKRVENIDSYEREKIDRTLSDLKRAARAIEIYLEEVDKYSEQGIKLYRGDTGASKLRYEGGPAGPNSDISKIEVMFQRLLVELKDVPKEKADEE